MNSASQQTRFTVNFSAAEFHHGNNKLVAIAPIHARLDCCLSSTNYIQDHFKIGFLSSSRPNFHDNDLQLGTALNWRRRQMIGGTLALQQHHSPVQAFIFAATTLVFVQAEFTP